MPEEPLLRKHPAHGVLHLPHQPTVVFDTVCAKDRRPWLATEDVHRLLREVWAESEAWIVGRYVIMPDHVHYFATPGEPLVEFENWVRFWKGRFTRQRLSPDHRWQDDHWDTRMRTREQYEAKWEYVRGNPVRKGLVSHVDDWPFAGEIVALNWD